MVEEESEIKLDEGWSLTAAQDSLTKDPGRAALVLRLGAAVNAIRATQRWTLACKDLPGPAGQRDMICSFLVATAYLKEAIDSLLRPHYREIARLAREDGAPEDVIMSVGQLMSTKPQSLYARLLVNARNRLVFHWSEDTFRHWAEQYVNPTVLWAEGTGNKDGEVAFMASQTAALDSLIPGAGDAEIQSRVGEVAGASGLLVGVFQRAIHAYLADYVSDFLPEAESS
jgi:hypothetical protein